MLELEFSIMSHSADPNGDYLRPLLSEFEARHNIRLRLTIFQWETAWPELVKIALHHHGPSVSQIGSTWASHLVALHALRPFAPAEVESLGGPAAFPPAVWQNVIVEDSPLVWAIPWLADTRMLYYRRDALERYGIDEREAFASPAALAATLAQLQAGGVQGAWVVPTRTAYTTIHNVSSWIWQAGGDFVSPDGRRALFAEPAAIAGLRAYFDLHRYLPPDHRDLAPDDPGCMMRDGQAAVVLSTPFVWIGARVQGRPLPAYLARTIAAAPACGRSFVGGSHLVIWQHAADHPVALELIRFLSSEQAQLASARATGLLPASLTALNAPALRDDQICQAMALALQTGRSFPTQRLWGLVEERLTGALGRVWSDVLARPDPDVETILHDQLDGLALRLNRTLEPR